LEEGFIHDGCTTGIPDVNPSGTQAVNFPYG